MAGGSTHSGGGDGDGGGNKTNPESSLSSMDSSKVTSVIKQLSTLIRNGQRFDSRQFNLCVSLARGIDYAIVNNEIPDGVDELPSLFKQVCGHNKNGVLLQATSMMLMASLKSACRSGWFLPEDAEELLNSANEVSVSFCNPLDIVIEPSNPPPVMSNIINRFYPWIKMTRIFASLEVKPGYGAYLLDFHVLKNKATIREKIRLFVAQTDNVHTSSCLITPQQANFLLNGKGIRRRIINSLDIRPQIPTNVTTMVKYGTNLLQAVGHFNGNYTIIIAFTSEASIDTPDLQHYARPLSAVNSLDSGIGKGVSRISLNCPISSRRISVPAKGRLCEHQQCFDYANYIKINLRRPSWRCPQCSQPVCYTDIYIDEHTIQVLKDVGENVADVIISADGSWKPVRETDDPANKQDKNLGKEGDEPKQCVPEKSSESAANVMEGIDKNISMDTSEAEDINPLENTEHVNESMEFDFTGILNEDTFPFTSSATSNTMTRNTRLNPCAVDPILEPSSTSFRLIRMPDDALIPPHNQDPISDNLSLQSLGSSRFWDLVMNGETGRQIPRNITRTQIAVQALPDQSLLMHSRQRARPSADAGGATKTLQQRFSSSNMDANSASEMSPTPPGFPPITQKWVPRSHSPSQPPIQQTVGHPAPSRFLGSYQSEVRISSGQTSEDFQNIQPSPRARVSQMASPPIMARAPPHLSRMQGRKGGSPSNVASVLKGKHSLMKSQQPAQSERFLPVVPVQLQPRRDSSSLMVGRGHKSLIGEQREGNVEAENPDFTSANKSSKVNPDQNWRPPGRMRGSLSGRAHSGALSQYIIRPTQLTSPSSIRDPPVNPFSTPNSSTGADKIPSHTGNNSDTHAPTVANQPTQVDPEVCVEPEVRSTEYEQENTNDVRGIKMQNHPTQVQAEKKIEDEAAEAGLHRIIGDGDEAERRRKKKAVAREELGLNRQSSLSTEHLNKTDDNVEHVIFIANRDGSIMSMENINHVPKEVERIIGKNTLSAIFKSKKLNAKNNVILTSPSAMRDPPVNSFSTPSGSTGAVKIPSHTGNNSDTHAPAIINQPTQVDPEVCVEPEVRSNEYEQENTDDVQGIKMQNHQTQVQAEKKIEDDAAEAGLRRIIGDDDVAEGKKKKKTVGREELGFSCQSGLSTGHLNKTNDNFEQVIFIANRDGSIMSMENINHAPKEVERILGKRTLSALFKSKNDVKEKQHSVRIVRERFICRACNQEGHMRTNKDCPMYGNGLDPKLKPANISNTRSPTVVDQPMQVDAEEFGEAERGNNESRQSKTDGVGNNESKQGNIDWVDNNEPKQCKTDGVGELKRKKHLTQVQTDEEVKNETAEPCRMFMDDDEAARKKKKNTIAEGQVELGSSLQRGSSAEQLNKTNGNIKQVIPTAQPDSSITSLENVSRDPKEVESGERTFSGKFNSESDVKVAPSATKNFRERFVCGACGQEGHMRTNKNCPRYGKDSEPQLKPTNNSNMRSPTLADQPMQVDHPKECREAEAANYESKQGQTDGVGELKTQKHLTQVQADEEVENETAEPCRMLMDDDESEQKRKKITVADGQVESGSSRQPGSSAEQLNKANGNIEQVIPTAQPDSSVTLLENFSRDPKEEGHVRTSRNCPRYGEDFVCSGCGEVGHMKSSKNCPRYGKDADAQVESSGTERTSRKR